jgi:hypothetical protein
VLLVCFPGGGEYGEREGIVSHQKRVLLSVSFRTS